MFLFSMLLEEIRLSNELTFGVSFLHYFNGFTINVRSINVEFRQQKHILLIWLLRISARPMIMQFRVFATETFNLQNNNIFNILLD